MHLHPTLPAGAHHRYAVYFAPPPGTLAWLTGSHWLGRCAALLEPLQQPAIPGVPHELLQELTATPRRYGWHATLMAPFVPAPSVDWLTLHQSVQALASSLAPVDVPPLCVAPRGNTLALVPRPGASASACARLQEVAQTCVRTLHPLAAPPTTADLVRRRATGLSPAQDALLQRWGYPFVMEEFRFHMTLTGPLDGLDERTRARLTEGAEDFFAPLPPLRLNSLALFAQATPGAAFALLDHLELGA